MKQFCLKVTAFFLLQAVLLTLLLWHYDPWNESNYLAQTVEKHRRLTEISSPKIVILGGSNVPFGIQSGILEAAFGRPVVNMGLAAGEGIDFMLNEVRGALKPGDLVLLSLEYDRFGGGFDPGILQQVLQYRPASLVYLRPKHFRKIVLGRGLQILGGVVRHSIDSLFYPVRPTGGRTRQRGFNTQGDLIVHYGQPARISPEQANSGKLIPDRRIYPSPETRKLLTDFARGCQQRQAQFAFSFPPHAPEPLRQDSQVVANIAAALKTIPHLTLLDAPEDQTYSPTLFYDTGYHLSQAGAEQRTTRLVSALKPFFQPP